MKTFVQQDYIWNPSAYENGKYFKSLIDDSVITYDEIIDAVWSEPAKTMSINFNSYKITCKMDNFYILLPVLLITTLLMIIVSIYYYYYHTKD